MTSIYLDNNATTALDPRAAVVLDQPYNPSSIHSFGREARNLLTKARRQIAAHLAVKPQEILFTSGGTEGINLLLRSLPPGHVITSNVEHSAVVTTLAELDHEVEELPVGSWGAVRADQIHVRSDTCAIVLIAANNETGVLTDLPTITGAPLIVDGVALLGKERFTMPSNVTAMVFSAHKFHGPKGVGFAFVRSGFPVHPQITGGPQEAERRGGTENLDAILSMAKAMELFESPEKMRSLRDELERGILARCPGALVNGEGPRLSNTTSISFPGLDGDALLMNLDLAGLAISHGSACSSGALEPSRVLRNMGYDRERAGSAIRFSLSRFTTPQEIAQAIEIVAKCVTTFRRQPAQTIQ